MITDKLVYQIKFGKNNNYNKDDKSYTSILLMSLLICNLASHYFYLLSYYFSLAPHLLN